jgi:hypothetical protein
MHNTHGALLMSAALAASQLSACSSDDRSAADTPTWNQDIAPLVSEKCGACHRDAGIAPFSMGDYAATKPWAESMADAAESGRMPPFLAHETADCQPRLAWADDLRLGDAEKAMLRAWAAADAPQGDEDDAAEIVPGALPELEREDLNLTLPHPIEVDGARDIHTCIVLDPELAEDAYVIGSQLIPGNTSVLHHVVSYQVSPGLDEDGTPQTKKDLLKSVRKQTGARPGERYDCFGGVGLEGVGIGLLDAWAPGGRANLAPKDAGMPLSRESLVILDTHYHPTGQLEVDEGTRLSLMFATETPRFINSVVLLGNIEERLDDPEVAAELMRQDDEPAAAFMIPAGAKDHVEEMAISLRRLPEEGFMIYEAATHMHYVGRDMRVTLEPAEREGLSADDECLIETPAWDFNWQRGYRYDAAERSDLPVLRNDDVLRLRCVYDNTMDNPHVARALADRDLHEPIDVSLGEDTLDEMCIAGLGVMYPNPLLE